jgi:hypothetical protein
MISSIVRFNVSARVASTMPFFVRIFSSFVMIWSLKGFHESFTGLLGLSSSPS